MYAVHYGTRTDIGRVRESNEDTLRVIAAPDTATQLFLIADGVGGERHGAVASQLGVQSVEEAFSSTLRGHDDRITDTALCAALRSALRQANGIVFTEAQDRHADGHMATTLVAVALTEQAACVGWVGDSRAYRLPADSPMHQITRDHSFINEQIERGVLSPEQAAKHPQRNLLLRSIGGKAEVEPEVMPLPITAGDMLLLCTDGLTRHVGDREIEHLLRYSQDAQTVTDQLVNLANERGGKDNISVIVLDFGKPPALIDAYDVDTLGTRPAGLEDARHPTTLPAPKAPRPSRQRQALYVLTTLAVLMLILLLYMALSQRV